MITLTEFIAEAIREDELYRFMFVGAFLDNVNDNGHIAPLREYDRLYKKPMKFVSTTRQIDSESGYAHTLRGNGSGKGYTTIIRLVFDKDTIRSKFKTEPYAYYDHADKGTAIKGSDAYNRTAETIINAKGQDAYDKWKEEYPKHQQYNEVEERVYTNKGISFKYVKEIHTEDPIPELEEWAKENKIPIKVLGRKFRFGR